MSAFRLGLIVPLGEEFGYIKDLVPAVRSHLVEGTYYYELDQEQLGFHVVVAVLGEMGLSAATLATERLLKNFSVTALALVGVAGSLDRDVQLGDVVFATSVTAYLYAAKAGSSPFAWCNAVAA